MTTRQANWAEVQRRLTAIEASVSTLRTFTGTKVAHLESGQRKLFASQPKGSPASGKLLMITFKCGYCGNQKERSVADVARTGDQLFVSCPGCWQPNRLQMGGQ